MTAGQVYFAIFLILASDALTWKIHSWKDGAVETKRIEKAVVATEKAQERTNDMVGTSDAKIDQLNATAEALKDKYHAETIRNCPLPVNGMQFLKSTAAAAHSAAR